VILGAVFLVVTGGEALYADMGHFGRRPIKIAWFCLVLPALVINYLGQGALLLENPEAVVNPFYRLAPEWALYPLVGLATAAAVIASQALISGAFSLTRQAVQLGYLPRLEISHTSKDEMGQIYVPFVNWTLLFGTVFLVIFFQSSSNMAAAYGMAVVVTMVITSILTCFVAVYLWGWHPLPAILLTIVFLCIDGAFLASNSLKIERGGWFPLMIGAWGLTLMTTWRRGRTILADRLQSKCISLETFRALITHEPPHRVPGVAVFMTSATGSMPPALVHNLNHNKILHETVILLQVGTLSVPRVPWDERLEVEDLGDGFYRLLVYYGFMDSPNIPAVLGRPTLPWATQAKAGSITYFLGRETMFSTPRKGMAQWREYLFMFMSRNAQRATTFFRIPSDQVVEIGIQVEL
jgi:KUP system potassium uptake protein